MFIQFCESHSLKYLPTTEDTLMLFIADCEDRKLRHGTITNYLYAIRSLQLENGFNDPLNDSFCIKRALKGIHVSQDNTLNRKLAIDHSIMKKLEVLHRTLDHNTITFWSAMTLSFFALLRCSEVTVKNPIHFDTEKDFTRKDVTFINENCMKVMLKHSKTDKIGTGVELVIGCTKHPVCAVCSMEKKLKLISDKNSPLFQFEDGTFLTRKVFIDHTRTFLALIGINPQDYSGYSYRIGGCTSGAMASMEEWELKLLGQWTSDCYKR
ncbi:unnamed protein product, partial [Owenia fusiformis]